jgi:hypothetical protein
MESSKLPHEVIAELKQMDEDRFNQSHQSYLGKDRSANRTPIEMRKAKNRAKTKAAKRSKQINRKGK